MSVNRFIAVAALAAWTGSAFAAVEVTGWSQNASTGQVTVNYRLTGSESAIVTLDVTTNDVSIGAENLSFVTGDANMIIAPSSEERTIRWRPDYAWDGHLFTNDEVKVKAVAWPLDNPPDYMAVCLSATNGANQTFAYRFYTAEGALPGTITNDCWRGEWLLMRRIHAAGRTFVMGSPITEQYRNAEKNSGACERFKKEVSGAACLPETPHPVSFTKDFYIGVFPFTYLQRDYGWASASADFCDWKFRRCSVYGANLNAVRGSDVAPDAAPAASSFLGVLRTRTGVAFDLPTEAQWEYACRAGTTTPFPDGVDVPADYYYSQNESFSARKMGWWCNLNITSVQPNYWVSAGYFPVGLLKANNWGLYDMNGNPMEWCRDRSTDEAFAETAVVDPLGTTGDYYVARGVSHDLWMVQGRSAARTGLPATYSSHMGFRVVCPCPVPQVR